MRKMQSKMERARNDEEEGWDERCFILSMDDGFKLALSFWNLIKHYRIRIIPYNLVQYTFCVLSCKNLIYFEIWVFVTLFLPCLSACLPIHRFPKLAVATLRIKSNNEPSKA